MSAANKLTKLDSDWAIFSIINNAKLNDSTLVAWRMVGGRKVTVEVRIRLIRKFRSELVVVSQNSRTQMALADLTTGTDKLNFYIADSMVLFQSNIKNRDSNGDITVAIPEMIAQVDRRKHLRIVLEENQKIPLSFFKQSNINHISNQRFNKTCYDISAGGLSFIINRTESKFFKVGDTFKNLEITLEGEKILVDGEVVNILTVEPSEGNNLNYRGQKICIKYSRIGLQSQKLISDYVFKYIDFSANVV